ncbi:LIM and calponin homology domains-containing protein 1-like isoform X3 [Mercenaria mercenaria]|uniref:LIM and calponin homology domains-containing protein 1-like isoform X3 n=1 Tax=Mercenaria mercenaria TaxID=6596 RepID=UPI00234F3AD0|nr:LIM and calponin homology domains-containing protein 1-like isoform X3 [Mercenaria mercenaria]
MAEDTQENEEEWIPIRLREDEEMDFFTELALHEAERWIQAVTRKKFEYAEDFRKSLGNGVLLCELLNCLKPGSVKRINKLPGAIAGLDNINVFLTACEKNFGLNKTQLFDPTDLEDLSNRAISDENEFFLKQEVDRRAINVAVTVYWLGRTVAGKYKGPELDASAFGALVHSHGNKNIISEDSFKNGSPLTKDNHKHIRDSSYDSLGSYERESESSFDELDSSGTMPVRSDMREMRRYGSASSLSMPRDLRLSTASGESMYSDDKHDGMYVSSPDLSQGSHAHTRSSSTDSMEGNYYGNHSRQSSGSTDNYATRRSGSSSSARKTSTSAPDPLQFVKLKGAADLAAQAKKQMEVAKEVNMMRGKVDSVGSNEEPDWQSNFNNWKSRRKSTHARLESDTLDEEEEKRPQKTFSQIMAEKEKRRSVGPMSLYPTEDEDIKMEKKDKRRSLGAMNFYPLEDDDSGIGVKTRESHISKTNSQKQESKPKNKSKADVAPWAHDSSGEDNSQSDSETNNSHQSGDTDSVFSDKSTPSKVLSDDDSWVKNKQSAQTVSSKLTPPVRTQRSLGDSMKIWENSANESQKKDDKKVKDLPANSAKIRNITQAFEQKDKEANATPVVTKRSEFSRSSLSKSLDLTDSYSKPYSPLEKKPPSPLSPTAPKALTPRDQRFSQNFSPVGSPATNSADKKFTEKTIKINQKPNNDKGFGFFLVGGCEKRQPVTVQRVSLGSAADVCEVEANDELLSVNGRDVTSLTLAQVQGMVDHSVKRGQIELRIKRYIQEEGYDSMEESAFTDKASINNNNKTDHLNETSHYKPALQMSTRTEEKPRLMDQLIGEQQREANNNERNKRAPSPVAAESFTADVRILAQSAPAQQSTPAQQTTPVKQTPSPTQDMSAPQDVTLTEERSTISVRKSPASTTPKPDEPPVQMQYSRTPVKQDSPPPPTPPKTELPPLAKYTESPGVTTSDDSSGFGPPAALLRWQRPRAKSEYQNPFSMSAAENQPSDRTKRLSATLPFKSDNTFSLDKDYSKDDSMMDKVSRDFVESVSVSKPVESKPNAYQFNDATRIEDWQKKQDLQRLPDQHSSTPPIELNIHREENLTAQSAAPARKQAQVDAPNLMEINIPNYSDPPPLSPQEKFERDQQRIRQQYEEEKRRAREAEKQKQEQEQQTLNSDKFLRDMESQILQTKHEAASQNLIDNEPIRATGTQSGYNSQPMTIRLPANSQGRQLVIDPRNQEGKSDNMLPEYSFRVDLPRTDSAPPLRTFNQPELNPEEILAKEREKIREEEKRKFEQEQQRWKEEKERELREQQELIEREREQLQREQERVEREKAMLEQKVRQEESYSSRYQPVNSHLRSSAGSSGSSLSQSPRSPPPALDPKYRETQSKKAPPPTAPKPDRASTKARLTREDLLAMNRKATPLTRPDPSVETTVSGDSHDNSLSPATREAPSKGELHSLNAVPKPKFHSSAAWIKDRDAENNTQSEKPFVIGKRSDLIHQRDYSNPSDHWLVREAEKRRLAEKSDYANIESVTAHAGPTKPSQSSLVSRFRGDIEPPPRSNRYSYPSSYNSDSRLSPTSRPLSATGSSLNQYNRSPEQTVTQFSAKTSPSTFASNPSLTQTLPPNFSFNANVRNQDSMPTKPPRSLTDDSGPVIAVSGKQKCSHCGEELGFGAAMVIESLSLYYHVQCFRCCVCRMPLGNGSEGTDVRVRVNKLHCRNCYSNDEGSVIEYWGVF